MIKLPHKGWQLIAYRQASSQPYLPFVCFARREVGGAAVTAQQSSRNFTGMEGFNREGATINQAVEACVREINR